jgi:hypothetical protein
MGFQITDSQESVVIALPASAGTVYSPGLQIKGGVVNEANLAQFEAQVQAPVLTTGQLGNSYTMTYGIQSDTDPAFGSPADILPGILVQTGAAGAGAAAANFSFRLPVDCETYIRLKVVGGASIGDCHLATATLRLLF